MNVKSAVLLGINGVIIFRANVPSVIQGNGKPVEANQKRKYEKDNCSMYRIIKQSKYGNVKKIYNKRSYMSKKEATYAQELDLRKKAHDIKSWKPQVKIDLQSNGRHICNYYIDFEVIHNDDLIEYIEVKGFETEVWRLKWKIFESIYGHNPNYKLTIVK